MTEELKLEAEKFARTEMSHPNEYGMYYCTFLKVAEPREKRIAELEAQIEKMKCCGNCENGELSAHEEPCRHCQRCFASEDITDQENVKDNWEAIKERKEK